MHLIDHMKVCDEMYLHVKTLLSRVEFDHAPPAMIKASKIPTVRIASAGNAKQTKPMQIIHVSFPMSAPLSRPMYIKDVPQILTGVCQGFAK
jgi:hypothetical protein